MAFLLKAIGLSDDIPGFPFTPASNDRGHVVYTSPLMCWTMRTGAPHDDTNKKVSIFTFSFSPSSACSGSNNSELAKQLAGNALRRAKSLMIPGFLKCLGAAEYRDTIYIATELCLPLKEVLENTELRTQLCGTAQAEYYASVAYGISTVAEALSFLHQNRLVHGNVNCQSVFVSPSSGVWRLFGFELVSSVDDSSGNSSSNIIDHARRAGLLEGYRCPPEYSSSVAAGSSNGAGTSASTEAFAIDAWCLAGLIYETVGITAKEAADGKLGSLVHTLSSAELRNACRQSLPKSLHSGCSGITAVNPRMRKTVQAFLEHCEFVKDSVFVQSMKGLSEVLLLDAAQQVRLVESLTDVVDAFPLRACLCYVLPRLGDVIRVAAKKGNPNGSATFAIESVVAPVLKIAARTNAGEDFDKYVTPALVQMFQCTDALMRYKLLVGAEVYGGKLSSAALNSTIWPLYARGFQYSTPSVREYSARALVYLAPHLNESVLSEQVPKALGLLQRDQDGALRTNATVALHLISSYITSLTLRGSVVLNFCRPMLRDSFEPSRVAALRSLRGTMDCFTPKQLAERVLPAVAPLTVDPTSEESRGAALALTKAATSKLEENHKCLSAQKPTAPNSSTPAAATSEASNTEAGTNSSSWGWGLFTGSPSATPAPTSAVSSSLSATAQLIAARHFDASSSSASSTVANPVTSTVHASGGLKANPLCNGAASSSSGAVPAVSVTGGGGSGWSDDDALNIGGQKVDDNDGWGDEDDVDGAACVVEPALTASTMKVKPLGATAAPERNTLAPRPGFTATSFNPITTTSTGTRLSSSGLHSSSHSTFTASPPPLGSNVSGSSGASSPMRSSSNPTSSGPMKLRKKGGLGAARLD